MIAWLLAALALPIASAWLLLRALAVCDQAVAGVAEPPRSGDAALHAGLAIGLGLGAIACLAAVVGLAGGGRGAIIAVDLAVCAAAAFAARGRAAVPRAVAPHWPRIDQLLAVLVGTAAIAAVVAFAVNSANGPHGEWDAMAIWNLRARCLVRAGSGWAACFSDALVHADYPLLLPAAVARLWLWGGNESTLAPIALAALFPAALLLVLYGAVARLRGCTLGLLAALTLLGTPAFLTTLDWQYADIPLAFFLLAALALLAQRDSGAAPQRGILLCAGLAAGFAAWTKNEGAWIVLSVVALRAGAALWSGRRDWRAAAWWGLGALPALLLLVVFKLALAPASELVIGQSASSYLGRVGDPARYALIAAAFVGELARSTGLLLALALALAALLLGRTPDLTLRRAARAVLATVALIAAGYAIVYLLTPSDLGWHLQHSLGRLILQLWPSLLLALFLWVRSPAEATALRPALPARREPARSARGR